MARDGSLWVGSSVRGGVTRIQNGTAEFHEIADEPSRHRVRRGHARRGVGGEPARVVRLRRRTMAALRAPTWVCLREPCRRFTWTVPATSSPATSTAVYKRARDKERFERLLTTESFARSIGENAAGEICVTDQIVGVTCIGQSRVHDGPTSPDEAAGCSSIVTRTCGSARPDRVCGACATTRAAGREEAARATALTGLLSDGVNALLEDREGNIWAGTTEGLNRLTPHKVTQMNLGVVAGVDMTSDGTIWVGTVNEVLRLNADGAPAGPPLGLAGRSRCRDSRRWRRHRVGGVRPRPRTASAERARLLAPAGHGKPAAYRAHHVRRRRRRLALRSRSRPRALAPRRHDHAGSGAGTPTTRDSSPPSPTASATSGSRFRAGTSLAWTLRGAITVYGPVDGLDGGPYRAIYEGRRGEIWLAGLGGLEPVRRGPLRNREEPGQLSAHEPDGDRG